MPSRSAAPTPSGHRRLSGTSSVSSHQPTPDPSRKLTESLSSLSLQTALSSPFQPGAPAAAAPANATQLLPRRSSMDLRHSAGSGRDSTTSSPLPDTHPRRTLSRAPSTPNIRKRPSITSLTSDGTSPSTLTSPLVPNSRTSLGRRSSMMSLRSLSVATPDPALHIPPLHRKEGIPVQHLTAPTTVVFHDTSYRHKYSRPNTTKADLASIVERPERISAATLGVTAAQTHIGRAKLSLRKSVRMGGLLDPEVMLVHAHGDGRSGKKTWPEELAAMCGLAAEKLAKGECEVPRNLHQGDLYLCAESREDMEGCLGALYDGVDIVFGCANGLDGHEMDEEDQSGVRRAFVCIRPPGHHCAETQPSGFCWLNNVHIAIAHAARQHGLTHAVILDFDLHHGDGSQSIAWTLNNIANSGNASTKKTAGIHVPNIGYFSLHDINSYPCEDGDMDKVKNASLNIEAHGQFIHNIHLKPYNSVEEFWELYENKYYSVIAKAREFLAEASVSKPKKNGREYKAGVFISAGFDASEHESSGMQRHAVNVPTSFYARFTSDALALAEQYCEGRVLSVLEGGYSDRALITGIMAHLAGLACPSPTTVSGFVPPTTGLLPVPEPYATRPSSADRGWDPEWWGSESIGELERYYEKMTFKKVVTDKPSTSYLSATTASIARSETPRRVVSSAGTGNSPPLPPPVIPWEVRAFELSRKIIPEFQESVEIPPLSKSSKNKRHSVAVVPDSSTRVLRDRKAKTPDAAAPLDVRRRRTTTGGAVSTASSRAPSRAPSRAMSTRGTTPLPPRDLEPIPIATGRRVVSASASPVVVAAPRPLARKSSVVGNSAGQRSPPVLLRKASLTTFDGTRTTGTSSTSPSASSGSTSPRAAVAPKKEVSDELVKKFAKIKITYKNREKEEEILRMERQKEELERKLEAEKKRLSRAAKKSPTTTTTGSARSPSAAMPNGGGMARARSVSGAGSVRAQVNGLDKMSGQGNFHGGGQAAEKETKMVTPPLQTGTQAVDRTYRGGDIKFSATGPEPGPAGFMGRTG
ncbi:uncharacterized protein LAJ45_09367 [Morchella importuna]|uniref:uncharacterized protein n=1 Tax=Morchella importuna TaxID=1174673 RepID=UPI001E8D9511|nr:uncharacterized protein LAJ45_09367 [Morchella importuna]KAH8146684.1 hypothetical protein LAJ45_09367 [Morchella importuna]